MEVLENRIKARRSNFEFYKDRLENNPNIEFLKEPKGFYSNRWLTCILTGSFEIREQIRLKLTEENIECRPLWKPLHLQPVFGKYQSFIDGTSEDIYDRGLCLPSGSNLSENELARIVMIISSITKKALKYA